eukprot:NODE_362_length_2175_cov_27.819849_g17_i19.p1 GENE.NODE_362_length_2175_cov_27.819849_g17_i19~~NODE_362_length_2175_cov_27.819849_g17_i19.p1  ORF type:complete len:356 (+),score=81.59 NODE_362_length_2175_cov_27.819849_g17_i19:191-1258(+)
MASASSAAGGPAAPPPMPMPSEEDSLVEAGARKVLEEIATVGIGMEVDVSQYIDTLSKYRQLCETRGWYAEAQLVHHVLKQLRLEEEQRHLLALNSLQEAEMKGLDEAHILEFQHFNRLWNERVDEWDEHMLDCEAQLLERHSAELAEFHAEVSSQPPNRPKFSRDYLNLRSIQDKLAKQKNYSEAAKVKEKADRLEKEEMARFNRERSENFARRETQILARHRAELVAMRKRMERGKAELQRTRHKELEQLEQRYKNVKRDLQGQQAILKAKTSNVMSKHGSNEKTEKSGASAINQSVHSGAFGPLSVQNVPRSRLPGQSTGSAGGSKKQSRSQGGADSLPPMAGYSGPTGQPE